MKKGWEQWARGGRTNKNEEKLIREGGIIL